MNTIGVSIIICCYNSATRISEVLTFLFKQQGVRDMPYEIIVVDNASTDNTAEIVSARFQYVSNCKLVSENKLGLVNARQKGIDVARYEYLLFCDDDNLLCDTYVQSVFRIMESDVKIGACGGKGIPLMRECEKPEWFDEFGKNYAVGSQVTNPQRCLYGAGMCVRYSAIKQMDSHGYVSFLSDRKGDTLSAGNDGEIVLAIRVAGFRLVASDDFFFWHLLPLKRLKVQYLKKMAIGFGMMMPVINIYNLYLDHKKIFSIFFLIFFLLVNSTKSFLFALTTSGIKKQFFLNYAYGQLKGIKLYINEISKISAVVKSISNSEI